MNKPIQSESDGDRERADDAEYERLEKLLERHAAMLGEHFESVCIIAVANRGDGRVARFSRGNGNYYSQYGSVRDWLITREQETRDHASE